MSASIPGRPGRSKTGCVFYLGRPTPDVLSEAAEGCPRRPDRTRLTKMNKFYNNIKTVVLLGLLSGLILLCGQLIGGPSGLVVALGLAVVMNFGSWFFSDKIALMATG